MKPFLVLFVCVGLVQGLVEWPFKNRNSQYDGTFVEASVGSPAQKLKLSLTLWSYCPGFIVYNTSVQPYNGFNSSASTTFHKTGDFIVGHEVDGVIGIDNFSIKDVSGKEQQLQQTPFNVVNRGICENQTSLSLTHSYAILKNNFLDSVLKNEKEKVVVLTFDNVPKTTYGAFSGKVTIGARPSTCSNWHTVSEDIGVLGPQWQFKLDSITVGKYGAFDPGYAQFNIYTPIFMLSHESYDQITKELGVINAWLPCTTTKEIIFSANGLDLKIRPEDYMDTKKPRDGYCFFFGMKGDSKEFWLPIGIFERYCLMLDMEEKDVGGVYQIGFGEKAN